MVIRNITPESYPLSQEHAAEVLMDVARRCFQGRQDVRLTYLEVLGMLRICLTAARLKLPVQFEDLITLSPTSLVIQKNGLTSTSAPPYEANLALTIPSLFGPQQVPISHSIYQFLHALAAVPSKTPRDTILQRPLRTLTRQLDNVLKSLNIDPAMGNITYQTFMREPHHFGPHRYQRK